jgi:hypothetical protein
VEKAFNKIVDGGEGGAQQQQQQHMRQMNACGGRGPSVSWHCYGPAAMHPSATIQHWHEPAFCLLGVGVTPAKHSGQQAADADCKQPWVQLASHLDTCACH